MIKAVILRFNQPAAIIPMENVDSISSNSGSLLLAVKLKTGEKYLGYHVKFES